MVTEWAFYLFVFAQKLPNFLELHRFAQVPYRMTLHQDNIAEMVIHPAHGLGQVSGRETLEMAGATLEVSVISFDRNKLTLRIPTGRLEKDGVRPLASEADVERMLKKLASPSKIQHADQYRMIPTCEEKISTGDLIAIAAVARDLYRAESVREIPYSVESTFKTAVMRLSEEMALVLDITEHEAEERIKAQLTDQRPLD